MLLGISLLVVAITALAYFKRHNPFLWIGVAMAWGWFIQLCAAEAGELLHRAGEWLFGA